MNISGSTHDNVSQKPLTVSDRRVSPANAFVIFRKDEINQSIPSRFEQQASIYPDRLAVKTMSAQITYRELNQAANRIARAILHFLGEKEAPVALFLNQGTSLLAAILGVLKSGKAYVPMDISFPSSRNASIIEDSCPGLLITDKNTLPPAKHLINNTIQVLDISEVSSFSDENFNLTISPDTIAYILYTSGSTGQPKGVFQSHRNVLHNIMKYTNGLHISPDDRLTLLYSCSFGASVSDIFGALLNGASLFPFNLREEGMTALADWLMREEITLYHSVPTVYRHFIAALTGGERFPNVRLIKLGGETVLRKDLDLFKKHFDPGCIFHVGYGATEMNIIRQFFCNHETTVSNTIMPVGYAVEDTEIVLLDENGQEAGFRCTGEIVIKSQYLALGYWRNNKLTAESFMHDPKRGRERIYRTGDLGYMLPDGCLFHLGRKDLQVKIRGYRVELSEIEMALNEISTVKEAVVAAHEDCDSCKLLVAYVVQQEGAVLTAGELHTSLKDKLPAHMIPSKFIFMAALPLTPNGKVDRQALPAMADSVPGPKASFEAPRNTLEKQLTEIWKKVLNLQDLGITDNFFSLGGHSLLAVQLVSEVKKVTGHQMPVNTLFQSPTIEQLAETIRKGDWSEQTSSPVKINPGAPKVPLFWVHDMFLAKHLEPDQPLYVVRHWIPDEEITSLNTVGERAAHYLKEVRSVRPKGPYVLGGYCFSSVVALEMARQLIQQGEEVSFLFLVEPSFRLLPADCQPADHSLKGKFTYHSRKITAMQSKEKMIYVLQKLPLVFPYIKDNVIEKIKIALCKAYLLFRQPLPAMLKVFYTQSCYVRQPLTRYTPEVYPGSVVIFQPEKIPDGIQRDWSSIASGRTEIHEIQGAEHLTIIQEPYIRALSKQLNVYLDQIHAKGYDQQI